MGEREGVADENEEVAAEGGAHDPASRHGGRSAKRFSIEGVRRLAPPPLDSGRFRPAGSTRPKQCPTCRSKEGVTHDADGGWMCLACRHVWR